MASTRRQILVTMGSLIAGALTLGPARAASAHSGGWWAKKRWTTRQIYRLSSRGRRASVGTKAYNANMRFSTPYAANQNRAHPGDNSRIVPLTVSQWEYRRLFGWRHDVADLRSYRRPRWPAPAPPKYPRPKFPPQKYPAPKYPTPGRTSKYPFAFRGR